MSTRGLCRRLERLEMHLMPAGEPLVVRIRYMAVDGSTVDGPRITYSANPNGFGAPIATVTAPDELGTGSDLGRLKQ